MKVVILAGGFGTRLSEETEVKPKPMVEIGGRPILWHIMKHYSTYGFNEFIVALGYKGDYIKRYMLDYYTLSGNITFDLKNRELTTHESRTEDWKVHLIDTGVGTLTGGRVKKLEPWLNDETFMVTYGDGVSNIDLKALLEHHRNSGRLGTVSAVRPPARFGELIFDGDAIAQFSEKPQTGHGWINGGFMVFEPDVFGKFRSDDISLEAELLEQLAEEQQLSAYRHPGFWQCMDTMRDVTLLRTLWEKGDATWRIWR